MKKKLLVLLLCGLMLIMGFAGCNRSLFDTTLKFDEAYIYMPDGTVVHGEVEKWRDFEDGDQLQVTIDGIAYLTHATNIVLIAR